MGWPNYSGPRPQSVSSPQIKSKEFYQKNITLGYKSVLCTKCSSNPGVKPNALVSSLLWYWANHSTKQTVRWIKCSSYSEVNPKALVSSLIWYWANHSTKQTIRWTKWSSYLGVNPNALVFSLLWYWANNTTKQTIRFCSLA